MCMGGGGGSDASEAAARAEQERQAKIAAAVNSVNSMFAAPGRNAIYNEHEAATREAGYEELGDLREEAARAERFRLARQGLAGGSAAADSEADLAKGYQRGVLRVQDQARDAAEGLRSRDEQARLDAIRLASSGVSTGVAQQVASQGLRSTAADASTAGQVGSLADLFANVGNQYAVEQYRGAGQGAINPYLYAQQEFTGVSSPHSKYSGRVT